MTDYDPTDDDLQEGKGVVVTTPSNQFATDMKAAGFRPYAYGGRSFYFGPAVTVSRDQIQDVIRATKVRVQQDSMGLDYVVYPTTSDKAWYDAHQDEDPEEDDDDE